MQSVLAKLYTDEIYRGLFFKNPEAAVESLGLPAAEAAALAALPRAPVEEIAGELFGKALDRIRNAYPAACAAAPDRVARAYRRYYAGHPSQDRAQSLAHLIGFGSSLAQAVGAGDPPYLFDLVRYERQRLCTKRGAEPARSAGDGEPAREARPRLARGTTVERHGFAVAAIAAALGRGEAVAPQPSACILAVYRRREDGAPGALAINAATERLLDLCDGRTDLAACARILGEELRRGDVADLVRRHVSHLVRLGVLHA
ncbi:hypothetical protein M446_6046 [Methylobacterium sp. 4-46]|nr:hypothetical protein M446_6046 [Methylobacterium sp. 4-46]